MIPRLTTTLILAALTPVILIASLAMVADLIVQALVNTWRLP